MLFGVWPAHHAKLGCITTLSDWLMQTLVASANELNAIYQHQELRFADLLEECMSATVALVHEIAAGFTG